MYSQYDLFTAHLRHVCTIDIIIIIIIHLIKKESLQQLYIKVTKFIYLFFIYGKHKAQSPVANREQNKIVIKYDYYSLIMVGSNELFLVGWSGIVNKSRDLKRKIGQRERRLNRRVKRVP